MPETYPAGFYVYALSDSRTGEAFYVGKGKGNRISHHEISARSKKSRISAKVARIRGIWENGGTVERVVIASKLTEPEAYELEREYITACRPTLTNITHGGGPASINPERARRFEAFQVECRRILDEIAVPTILRHLDTYVTLDATDPDVRRCLDLLWRADVREFKWRGTLVGLSR